jgi:hypothetical protein
MVNVGDVFPTTKDGDVEVLEIICYNELRVKFVKTGNVKVVTKCNLLKKMVADMVHRKYLIEVGKAESKAKIKLAAEQRRLEKAGVEAARKELREIAKLRVADNKIKEAVAKQLRQEKRLAAASVSQKAKEAVRMAEQAALWSAKNDAARSLRDSVGFYSKTLLNDFQDSAGKFGKIITADGKSFSTRSNAVWTGIVQRCKVGGRFQTRFKHYLGATVCKEWSEDFQVFAEWYTKQVGYDLGWDVDKDSLSDSKHYSPSTCILLPRCINLLFTSRNGNCLADATKLDGIPRWRTPEGVFFTCFESAVQHQVAAKIARITLLREEYVPLGIPDNIFDRAISAIT